MNRFHKNHPDPEIRQKYSEWQTAWGNYRARAAGFSSAKQHAEAAEIQKKNKRGISAMLTALGGHRVKAPAKAVGAAAQAKKRMLRTTGQRGS